MSCNDKIIPFPGQPKPGALILRVDLVFGAYPVWRLLRIAEHATFWDLHAAIQDAMGWRHRHRHMFTVDKADVRSCSRFGIPESESFYGRQDVLPSWGYRVREFARIEHPPFLYTYHLGEQWHHEVMLEAVQKPPVEGRMPSCLAGEGACPLEDIGGPEVFIGLMNEPRSQWPVDFDPSEFLLENVRFCDPRLLWIDTFGDSFD